MSVRKSTRDGFSYSKDILSNWPYAEERLLQLLDPDLIERHAQAQLSRALNIGRVIAVVGSGVSNAYGRPTWVQLLRNFIGRIEVLHAAYKALPAGYAEPDNAYVSDIEILRSVQERLDLSDPLNSHKGDLPIAFQTLNELEEAFRRFFDQLPSDVPARLKSGGDKNAEAKFAAALKLLSEGNFRKRVQRDTFDERGRARLWLSDLHRSLEYFAERYEANIDGDRLSEIKNAIGKLQEAVEAGPDDLSRDHIRPASDETMAGRRQALAIYCPEAASAVFKNLQSVAAKSSLTSQGVKDFVDCISGQAEVFCQPNLRFVMEAASKLSAKIALLDSVPGDILDCLPTGQSGRDWPKAQPTRFQLNPPHRDPLNAVFTDLGVERFLTTNYDNEIEHMMRDRGFLFDTRATDGQPADGAAAEHVEVLNVLGTRGDDFVFDEKRVADLIDFGVHGLEGQKRIMHLHGRSVEDADIVITERDYQELYYRDDGRRDLVDDAMALTFSANPLIFLGLGMQELDILRPLRAFVSQRNRLSDRVSVAILPRLKTIEASKIQVQDTKPGSLRNQSPGFLGKFDAADTSKQVELLTRYGVYSQYYGAAEVVWDENEPDTSKKAWEKDEEDRFALAKLLFNISEFETALTKIVWHFYHLINAVQEKGPYENTDSSAGRTYHHAKLKKCCEDLQSQQDSPREKRKIYPIPSSFRTIEGQPAHQFPVDVELGLLNKAQSWAFELAGLIAVNLPALELDNFDDWMKGKQSATYVSEAMALVEIFRELGGAFFTPFFTAHLAKVRANWSHWNDNWLRPPLARDVEVGSTDQDKNHPVKWFRHQTALRELFETGAGSGSSQSVSTDRFFEGAPPPALFTLSRALKDSVGKPEEGRRLIVLLSKKGVGEGHLFSTFRDEERFFELTSGLAITKPDGQVREDALPEDTLSREPSQVQKRRKELARKNARTHRAFFNLGLSLEVMSVFDQMSDFLFESLLALKNAGGCGDELETLKADWGDLKSNRLVRLEWVLDQLHAFGAKLPGIDPRGAKTEANPGRIVLAISQASIFFGENGRAKNAQLFKLLNTLVSEKYHAAPLDIFLVMNEQTLPHEFTTDDKISHFGPKVASGGAKIRRPEGERLEFVALRGERKAQNQLAQDDQRLSSSRIARYDKTGGQKGQPKNFVHLLDDVRPLILAARFFPASALAISWRLITETISGDDRICGVEVPVSLFGRPEFTQRALSDRAPAMGANDDMHPDQVLLYQRRIRTIFEYLFSQNNSLMQRPRLLDRLIADTLAFWVFQDLGVQAQEATEGRLSQRIEFFKTRLKAYDDIQKSGAACPSVETTGKSLNEYLDLNLEADGEKLNKLGEAFNACSQKLVSYYNRLSNTIGRHRYGVTVALAAFDDMLEVELRRYRLQSQIPFANSELWLKPYDSGENIRKAALEKNGESFPIRKFLDRFETVESALRLKAGGQHLEMKEDKLVEHVLAVYESQHEAYDVWPFKIEPASLPDTVSDQEAQVNLARALESASGEILQKLQDTILVDLSLISQPVDTMTLAHCPRINKQLSILYEKCLAAFAGNADPREVRLWALQRVLDLLVHRCLIFRLQPKIADKEGHDRFAVHRTVKRLVFRRFARPLVDTAEQDQLTVSLYATQPNSLPRPSGDAHAQIRDLIENLSNYEGRSTLADTVGNPAKDSYASTERLRAAYGALRSAYSMGIVSGFNSFLHSDGVSPPGAGYLESHRLIVRWLLKEAQEKGSAPEPVSALYSEEIAWLYNECGVLSLLQGRMMDAAALFKVGLTSTRRNIEPNGGPVTNRIGLNKAICDIERGRPFRAVEHLKHIVRTKNEHEALRLIATGYLGLVDHIRGDSESARIAYEVAENGLADIGRYRGASIFARHHADLMHRLGRSKTDQALELINRSLRHAANGNHEDVGHLARLSQLKICFSAGDLELTDVLNRLTDIEVYARSVGAPRYLAETAGNRAHVLMRAGETHKAAEQAMLSLQHATHLGLQLRRITALMSLAGILSRQSRATESRRLYQLASSLATSSQFFSARNIAEKFLQPEG